MNNALKALTDTVSKLKLGNLTWDSILQAAILVLVGMMLIRILLKIVDQMLERSKSMVSLKTYIHSVVKVLLWVLLAMMVAGVFGVDVSSVIALLSVAGLAVSLALQNTLSNVAGGIMLLVSKPFAVGDYIEADGVSGTVSAIDLAYCTITTVDNKEIFIPNNQIAATKIVNYNRLGRRRAEIFVTASYDAPTETVKGAIREALDSIPQILSDPAPAVWLSEYQSSSIQYVVRAWATSEDYWDVYYTIIERIRESFERHNVEMTYDHLNVHIMDQK